MKAWLQVERDSMGSWRVYVAVMEWWHAPWKEVQHGAGVSMQTMERGREGEERSKGGGKGNGHERRARGGMQAQELGVEEKGTVVLQRFPAERIVRE